MIPFSYQTRAQALQQLKQHADGKPEDHPYDLIVIGGGITGAGVLRDATLRGMKTLLLEKNDFASGTSSKSSKLVHGGLRYLKQFEFALTRESCVERNLLTRLNPHLVKPIPFVFPVYQGDKDGMLAIRTGMWLYEMLSGFQNHERHKMLSVQKTLEQIPDLNAEGLKGSAYYFDAAVDDVRLTLETIKSAIPRGGTALNYAPVTGFLYDPPQTETGTKPPNARVCGVRFEDRLTGTVYEARGRVVLNATGVWVDEVRELDAHHRKDVRPSKGIHIVVPSSRVRQKATLAFTSFQDKRLMFAIPWGDVTLIGTTDTFFDGSPEDSASNDVDVDYVLAATNHVFPNAKLTEKDLVSAWAGLRPLIAPPEGVSDAGAVSREHQIFEDSSGLLSIAGGKLTTYRRMAAELVDRAIVRLPADLKRALGPCATDQPLTGKPVEVDATVARLQALGQPESVAQHLVHSYGSSAEEVLELCRSHPQGLALLQQGQGFLAGEVLNAVRHESALHLTDLLTRRMRFAVWVPGQGLPVAETASRLMAEELGWDEAVRGSELAQFEREVKQFYRPRSAETQSAESKSAQ